MPTLRSRQSLRMAAALAAVISICTISRAQTVNPPQYPLTTLPYPYLYLNAGAHWAYMSPQNTNTTRPAFLPSVPLTRIVGPVHWPNIQPSGAQSSWDPALASIGTGSFPSSQTDCTLMSPTDPNASKWWVNASCWGGANGTYTSSPNNILYTFYNVPQWASVTHGTYPSTTSPTGWKVTNVSTTGDCTSSTGCSTVLTIQMTSGASGLATHAYIDVNISDGTSYHSYEETGTYGTFNGSTLTQTISLSLHGAAANPTTSNTYVSFTSGEPPSDVLSTAACPTLPDGSSGGNGDCFFKSYVTWMMMNTCRDLNGKFGVTLSTVHDCVIHYWEGWNEFNSDTFWTGNYTTLARMMVDANNIIKQYCSNCFFVAGSVASGGDAGHYVSGINHTDGAGVYIEAIGQLLKDWYAISPGTKPDIVSVHPYPGYDNIYMPAMPETNAPVKFDPAMTGYTNNNYSYTGIQACTGTYSNNGFNYGLPIGCVNVCKNDGTNKQISNVSGLGCDVVVQNPWDSTYGVGNPHCTAQNTGGYFKYQKASTYSDPSPAWPCRDSFVNAIRAMRAMLTGIYNAGDIPGTVGNWVATSLPIWNTESGWGSYKETNFVGQNAHSPFVDPVDPSLTTFYQQAYIARYAILGANSSAKLNLWYQWDEATPASYPACTGTCPTVTYPPLLSNPNQSFIDWGQLGNKFTTDPNHVVDNYFRAARPAYTFNRVYHWLAGASFNGPTPPVGTLTWTASHAYGYGQSVYAGNSIWTVVVSGTSGATAPGWTGGLYDIVTDGGITWQNMGDKNCYDSSTYSAANTPASNVFKCFITKSGGYSGTLVWFTPFDQTISFPGPSGQDCLKDIDGNLKTITDGSSHTILNRPALFDNTASGSCSGTDGLPESQANF